VEVADERALNPATGVLTREEDDRVEALRRIAKGRDAAASRARDEIEQVLEDAASREWDLLVAARRAIMQLPMTEASGLSALVKESRDRVNYRIIGDVSPARRAPALAAAMRRYEHAADLAEDIAVRGDRVVRGEARTKGRAIDAIVSAIHWGNRPGQNPCNIELRTRQPVLRVRRGTTLRTIDGAVTVRVEVEREDGADRVLEVLVQRGVRTVRSWNIGLRLEPTGLWLSP
jgi:hypothetical protein